MNKIRVKNREGLLEPLNIKKIQEKTFGATEGLEGVSQSELEVDAQLTFFDGITTEQIQKALIDTAVDKIDIDRPNWTFVAARLFLSDLYHKVGKELNNKKGQRYPKLETYLTRGEEEGRIFIGLKNKFFLEELDSYIKEERDLQFTYLGIKTMYDRYILKAKNGNPIELPQLLFMGVSMFIAQNEESLESLNYLRKIGLDIPSNEEIKSKYKDESEVKKAVRTYWAKSFYDTISTFDVMLATPTLSNARTPRHQLSSCFKKDEEVLTSTGLKKISDIENGDYVLTHNKRFRKVYDLFKRDYNGYYYTVKVVGNETLSATEEHPILAILHKDISCIRKYGPCLFNQKKKEKCFSKKEEYKEDCEYLNRDFSKTEKWIAIKDLNKNDYISVSFSDFIDTKTNSFNIQDIIPLKNMIVKNGSLMIKRSSNSFYRIKDREFINNQINSVTNTINLNYDFFLLIGYFLAEGHILKDNKGICFTFGTKEISYIEETKSLLKNIFGINNVLVKNNKDNSTNVIVHSKILGYLFEKLVGTGFDKKRLSNILKYAEPKNQIGLLIGAIRGDGCAIPEGIQLTMSNKELIKDLQEIALRNRLSPILRTDKNKNKLATVKATHLIFNIKNDKDFILKVGKNIEKIDFERNNNGQTNCFWNNEKYFIRVKEISKELINEPVYNIEVEEDHSYSVSGFNVHNCYVGSTPDTIEGIFDAYKEQSLLSKFGGGIGWDWNQVRGIGGYIDNHKNAAGGIIPFLKIENDIAIAVDQLGTRKGAIAVYIEPWHIDLVDFIDLKKNSGEERRRTHDLFPALWLNDLFMKRVANNEKWTLFNPEEVSDLSSLYGEEFEKRYLEYEADENIEFKEVYDAKELWKNILLQYFETGSPFLCYKDNANKRNPNKHAGVIRSSNLCVTGDTRLHTQFGLVTAKELFDSKEKILATYDKRVCGIKDNLGVDIAECIEMHKTAENASIYKITTKDGYEIKSTDWHEYYVNRNGEIIKIPLKDINPETDKLLIQSGKGQFGIEDTFNKINVTEEIRTVPKFIFKSNERSVKKFLEKVFEINNSETRIKSHSKDFVKDIQILLSNFGIYSKISREDSKYVLTILKKEEFETDILSIEYIGKEDVYDTTQLENHSLIFNGIVTGNCTEIFQNTEPNHYKVKVEFEDGSIEYFEEEEIITTDEGSTKKAKKLTSIDTLNGKKIFFTEKVAEEGDTAVCNLASINLSKVNTKEKIERVVPIAIRMLDNVIDLNFYPVKKTKKTNMKTRAIGLGVMGEAEMLATNKIYFGSDEHFNKIDEIMDNISFNAIKSSSKIAQEKGIYPLFNGSDWSKGIMPFDSAKEEAKTLVKRESTNNWDSLREEVKKNGIRNGYLMAIAPTSSISILVGTTQAIEPVYKRKWYEENLSGLIPVVVPKLSVDTWQYYETAYDLDQLKLVRAGAVRQKWIDQGQSLNIFIRLDIASAKLLNDIYMEAWRLGVKSNYYLRSESPKTEEEMSVADRSIECLGCQ